MSKTMTEEEQDVRWQVTDKGLETLRLHAPVTHLGERFKNLIRYADKLVSMLLSGSMSIKEIHTWVSQLRTEVRDTEAAYVAMSTPRWWVMTTAHHPGSFGLYAANDAARELCHEDLRRKPLCGPVGSFGTECDARRRAQQNGWEVLER